MIVDFVSEEEEMDSGKSEEGDSSLMLNSCCAAWPSHMIILSWILFEFPRKNVGKNGHHFSLNYGGKSRASNFTTRPSHGNDISRITFRIT